MERRVLNSRTFGRIHFSDCDAISSDGVLDALDLRETFNSPGGAFVPDATIVNNYRIVQGTWVRATALASLGPLLGFEVVWGHF
jgi:hypothetical protein